jgi:hypothetical protein
MNIVENQLVSTRYHIYIYIYLPFNICIHLSIIINSEYLKCKRYDLNI